MVDQVCRAYIDTHKWSDTWVDLILFDLLDFDIILSMGWLAPHHDVLDHYAKTVTLVIKEISLVVWQGFVSQVPTGNI